MAYHFKSYENNIFCIFNIFVEKGFWNNTWNYILLGEYTQDSKI